MTLRSAMLLLAAAILAGLAWVVAAFPRMG